MNKKTTNAAIAALAAIFITASSALAAPGGTPQASIGLKDFNVALCYHNDTAWSLSKDPLGDQPVNTSPGVGTITWIVSATKGATSSNEFIVYGYVTVTNGGSGIATLGNIVVNLQKRANNTWVSAAADISTKSVGDVSGTLGASANIVAAGSQETPADNAAFGAGNYATGVNLPACSASASVGTFYTTAGSVKLQFFNEDDNSEWAMTDTTLNTVPAGGTRHLLYKAFFDPVAAGIGAGDQVRVETLVTFGNAGGRGGSGASLPNVDIDMDSFINVGLCSPPLAGPEDNVRTVPTRFSTEMPGLINCNSTVHLQDDGPYLNPNVDPNTVTSTNAIWPTLDALLTGSAAYSLSLGVNGGPSGGSVCNAATLTGVNCNGLDCVLNLTILTTSGPTNVYEPCCVGVNLSASSCVTVEAVPPSGFDPGAYCTFTQGGWGSKPNGNNPGAILAAGFDSIYGAAGVTLGGSSTMTFKTVSTTVITKHGHTYATNTITITGPQAIDLYLPASKTPDQLNTTLINPDKTHAGVFGGQVLALRLNVDFSAAGVSPVGLGGLKYCAGDLPSISGLTVSQILAKAEAVLGGATPASQGLYQQDGVTPMSVSQLNDLITQLNEGFDNCTPTAWASQHLCQP